MIIKPRSIMSSYLKYVMTTSCTLILACNFAAAKEPKLTTVKGLVFAEETNYPVIGATIEVKGTDIKIMTDSLGEFILKDIPTKSTITVSHRQFIDEKRKLKDLTFCQFMLKTDYDAPKEESVNIGYGSSDKKTLTTAVSKLDYEEVNNSGQDLNQSLSGQVAGVSVSSGSGEVGSTGSIQIRGINSLYAGGDPLFVVDGIPQSGDPGLSSSEVESIDILKDAAAAAVYGTRGAGGVILITTKKFAAEEKAKEAELQKERDAKKAAKEAKKAARKNN